MSFDFSTLITDRSPEDLQTLRDLLSTPMEDWTADQLAAFSRAKDRGAYNYTDLTRVTQCMDYLNEVLTGLGYVTGYQKIEVAHTGETLPAGYSLLEYIQSSGTQYIDTGFKQNQNTRVTMDAQLVSSSSGHSWLFDGRISSSSASKNVFLLSGSTWSADYNGSAKRKSFPSIAILDRLKIGYDKNVLTINDETVSWTAEVFQSTANLVLLACNPAGAISNYASAKLYECSVYNDGELIREYVPCKNPAGDVGLFDLVSGQFYGNSGTGSFTSGPEVTPDPGEMLDPYTWYETDIPTYSQMQRYIANISALRGALTVWETTPSVPADMSGLTQQEANDIEIILDIVEQLINNMAAAWFFSGDVYSGEVDA